MEFVEGHPGEFAALLTSLFRTVSPLSFETATILLYYDS